MDYITAEQFLKQPEEIRKVLLSYALGKTTHQGRLYTTWVLGTWLPLAKKYSYSQIYFYHDIDKQVYDTITPIFTETQLRHFIEEKTGKITFSGMTWAGDRFIEIEDEVFRSYRREEVMDKDLLQAYWKYACRVAKEA